ncbi:hypothetical protein [Iningainema tapete]|uniref:Uncharacterized protein n=1 Tax=Iningainema tapete BLCC-T55 TaxID=2748662 RepID=A0A8J6XHR0_9CYAN|nr:hypothetical protein [Iningainema tapete]MBD2776154.1 hypothetical protein [Iningainema tapete BLCC-T55]
MFLPYLVPMLSMGMHSLEALPSPPEQVAEPLNRHSQVEPGNEMPNFSTIRGSIFLSKLTST